MAAGQYSSIVDSSWELIDPNPDIHQLFSYFNEAFFWGKLSSVYVQWSPRMTLCAGLCRYHGRNRECSIHLSKPLLQLRPRKDLVETLLHEMIHAYLFVADNNRERESHGPKFLEHMYRINKQTGANITVYHSFHDEVDHYKTHWWKCDGPCQHRPPFYGIVKRSMNRAPGPSDFWHKDHQKTCGGKFIKIKEPTPKKGAKPKVKKENQASSPVRDENNTKNKITNYFTPTSPVAGCSKTATQPPMSPVVPPKPVETVEPFSGKGYVLGSIGNSSATVAKNLFGTSSTASSSGAKLGGGNGNGAAPFRRGEHPLLAKWYQNDKAVPPARLATNMKAKATTPSKIWKEPNMFSGSSSSRTQNTNSSRMTGSSANPVDVITLD